MSATLIIQPLTHYTRNYPFRSKYEFNCGSKLLLGHIEAKNSENRPTVIFLVTKIFHVHKGNTKKVAMSRTQCFTHKIEIVNGNTKKCSCMFSNDDTGS